MRSRPLLSSLTLTAAILFVSSATPDASARKQDVAVKKGFRATAAAIISKYNPFSQDLPKAGCGKWIGQGSAPWAAIITVPFRQNWFVIGSLLGGNFIVTSSANMEVRYKDSYDVAFTHLEETATNWKVKGILQREGDQGSTDVTLIQLDRNIDLPSLCLPPKVFKYTHAQQEYIPVFEVAYTNRGKDVLDVNVATKYIMQPVEIISTAHCSDDGEQKIRKISMPKGRQIGHGGAILQKDAEGDYVMAAIVEGIYWTTHTIDAICITKDIRKWIVKTILNNPMGS